MMLWCSVFKKHVCECVCVFVSMFKVTSVMEGEVKVELEGGVLGIATTHTATSESCWRKVISS